MSISTTSFLLVLYISCETLRANYAYYAFHNFPQISAPIIALLSEIFKLSIAAFFLLRSSGGISIEILSSYIESAHKGEIDLRKTLKYALPAALYLINNLIYYTVLPLTSPSLLQVCILAKLPTTGILHHYLIKRQCNVFAWFSLLCLCIGLAIFNIPSNNHQSTETGTAWYLAPIAGFVIACLSALASISAETSTKEGEFWESQAYLYIWGIIFATIAYPLAPSGGNSNDSAHGTPSPFAVETVVLELVVMTAGTGLVVAAVLRARDNILKLIGTAASLITIALSQFVLLPQLRASTFTTWKICGGGIVTISTWCYNYYSQEPWPTQVSGLTTIPHTDVEAGDIMETKELEVGEDCIEDVDGPASRQLFRPDATKISVCAILIAFATVEVFHRTE